MTNEKQRHYLHGDQAEGDATFYCSACDIFFAAAHFDESHSRGHIDAGAVRYERELKAFEQRRQWHKDRFSRPADAGNIFAPRQRFNTLGVG